MFIEVSHYTRKPYTVSPVYTSNGVVTYDTNAFILYRNDHSPPNLSRKHTRQYLEHVSLVDKTCS